MTGRLYDLRRWRRASRAFLAAHRLCHMCEQQGRTSLAQVVGPAIFWRPRVLRGVFYSALVIRERGSTRRRQM